ncbi:uncharacterized protein SPAPADRAFT_50684 [Spathaspora passalidarum NRRL Y-27907]|uniref:GSKIP domain-containing protein n=1 Tax=Spathaspora passalidarum (strain NRRL Y-27907 / 11-Y1) TaxID=619300 RepID=G3APB3_SPAPN|nr:uncharacterized protein SPAPADRAFT_50684 [Spathaspora passalidarum NRRL Y-27907]EGW32090.1 hypothetical protein SPAPADRAFT_50684 [Spathaspora passalidarum NRRL Y-27907]
MDIDTQVYELTTIHKEYESFFPQCQLKLGNVSVAARSYSDNGELLPASKDNYIYIQTQEGIDLKVSVELRGWYQLGAPKKSYETFEGFMQAVSPSFQVKFGDELSNKLLQVLQQS